MELRRYYVEDFDNNTAVEADYTMHSVYAHGKLRDAAGYDIVCAASAEDQDLSDRVEKCVAVLSNGKEIDATLFVWTYRSGHSRYVYHRGLLVSNKDKESLEYARKAYKEKRSFI